MSEIGSREWNNQMFQIHATPYRGIAGRIEEMRVRSIIRAVRDYRKTKDRITILEVGCEAGHLLYACEKKLAPCTLWGLDISDNSLEAAKKRLNKGTQFIRHDITKPIDIEEKFDFILCSETLEHIPDYPSAIKNIRGLADEHTILIFTVPIEKLKNQLKKFFLRIGVFHFLFGGIEEGLSEWHVNDFSRQKFQSLIGEHFDQVKYQNILNMHQLIVAKPR